MEVCCLSSYCLLLCCLAVLCGGPSILQNAFPFVISFWLSFSRMRLRCVSSLCCPCSQWNVFGIPAFSFYLLAHLEPVSVSAQTCQHLRDTIHTHAEALPTVTFLYASTGWMCQPWPQVPLYSM